MQYSIARAELVAEQVRQFSSRHPHQLAGHYANLQFWLSESKQAIRVLDEYSSRFRRLCDAQVDWVNTHQVSMNFPCPVCEGPCELGPRMPPRPVRLPSDQIEEARAAIRTAVVRLLVRFYHLGLMEESEIRENASVVGAPFETEDLELLK